MTLNDRFPVRIKIVRPELSHEIREREGKELVTISANPVTDL
jgi:hypothetical protein